MQMRRLRAALVMPLLQISDRLFCIDTEYHESNVLQYGHAMMLNSFCATATLGPFRIIKQSVLHMHVEGM